MSSIRVPPIRPPVLAVAAVLAAAMVLAVGARAHDPTSDPRGDGSDAFGTAPGFFEPVLTTAPPTDPDVESVLIDGERLLAGTASGVWSYDGLEWSHHAFDDTVRWMHREMDRIWAGATRGIWVADAKRLDFELEAEGPAGNRCRLAETDDEGARVLWVGADGGLFRHGSGGWEHVRAGARVQTLARHPSWGLLAGTWGEGLWILEPNGGWRDLRSPAAGLTDTLSGNYVHDLAVDRDGAVRMACSWGGLERRFIAHDHARERGWITQRDPHDFRRASLVRYDGRSWEVTYLFQNYTEVDRSEAFLIEPVFRDDIDGDGHLEWVVLLGVGRNLHPEGLACFDLETLECEWFRPLPSSAGDFRSFLRSGRPHFVFASENSDHGAILPYGTDHEAHLQIIGPDGSVLRGHEFDRSIRTAHPMTIDGRPLDESDTLRVYERPATGKRSPVASWTLSLATLELAPADSLWGKVGARILALPNGLLSRAYPRGDQSLFALHDPTVADDHDRWPEQLVVDAFGQRPRNSLPLQLPGARPGALLLGEEELGLWGDGQLLDRSPYPSPAGERELVWTARDWHFDSWLLAVDRAGATVEVWSAHPAPTVPAHSRSAGGVPLDTCPRVRSVATLPMAQAGSDRHFSCRLASRVDSTGTLTGWIEARSDAGSLPVLDSDGHRIDGLSLPTGLADARDLRWLTGEPAVLDGKEVPALVDQGRIPFSIYLLDPEHRSWRGPLRFDLPFQDLHANGVTALDPAGRVVGTDTGLRRTGHESPRQGPWPGDSSRRVRGIEAGSDGRRLVWGSSGIGVLEGRAPTRVGRALDLLEWNDELWLLAHREARHRGRDGRWEPLTSAGLPDQLGERSRLLYGPDGVWCQPHWLRKVVHAPRPLVGPEGPWASTHSPLYFQGNERTCSSILALDERRWLAATEWGLTLLTDPRSPTVRRRNLLPDNTACTAMVRVGSRIVVARADGRIHELELPEADELRDSPRSRPRARAVLEMRAEGGVVWVRTRRGLEKWALDDPSADRRWELPEPVETLAMDVSSTGGPWLGTTDGIWRLTAGGDLLSPTDFAGIEGRVSRIWELGPEDRPSLAFLSDGEVWELELRRDRAEARYQVLDEQVRVALWDGGPRPGPNHAILRTASETPEHATASLGDDGIARFDLPSLGRGRHHVTLTPLDELGREARPSLRTTLRVRVASPATDLLAVLLPVPLLAVWVFLARRRLWLGLLAVLVAAAVPVILHFGLMFEVPWTTSSGVSVSLLITGLVLLGRDLRADLPPSEAIHRLSLLLAAFRHRGRGVSPVHRLLIVARNLENLVEAGDDVATETEGILREVLEATDHMESELPSLIAHSGLRSPLLRRLQTRLEELRETASELLADRRRLLQWCADRDERLATQELCHTFVRSVAMASQLIRGHESTDLRELLTEFRGRKGLRAEVEVDLDDEVGEVPIPSSGLSEILENLESNAIEANGGVAPRLRIEVRHNSGGDLRLIFEDDGPGVPAGDRERVFELGTSGTGSGGTGLHRCRTLAAGWGGTLRCEEPRTLGGARFVMEVPLRGGG